MILAWHVAAFNRCDRRKKLPDLSTLLKQGPSAAPEKPLTMAQQKSQLLMLSQFLGVPVRPGKPKKKKHG